MKQIAHSKLFKHIIFITCYLSIIWLLQLILTSILTFFHLSLNHPLGIIEQWLFSDAPFLIIITKILSAIICILFIKSSLSGKHLLKECLNKHKSILKQPDYIPMIFWFLLLLMIGRPNTSSYLNLDFINIVESYIGNCIFWISDLVIIFILNFVYPLKKFQKVFSALYLGFLSSFLFNIIYPYAAQFDYFFFFIWCAILFFSFSKSFFYSTTDGKISLSPPDSFTRPFVFIILVVAPTAAFFGADIIWGREFSFYILDIKRLWPIGLSGVVILSFYFNWWYSPFLLIEEST